MYTKVNVCTGLKGQCGNIVLETTSIEDILRDCLNPKSISGEFR